MKTKLFTIFCALIALATANSPLEAQSFYQRFWLSTDLQATLNLTQAQVDSISKSLLTLNYDYNNKVNKIADLDQQIQTAQNDLSQSPAGIGNQVASLTTQKVTISRDLIAEIQNTANGLFSGLTPTQQNQLRAIQNSVQMAYNILNAQSEAYSANLMSLGYFTTSFDNGNGNSAGFIPPPTSVSVMQSINSDVEQVKARRASELAEQARARRTVSQMRKEQ